MRVATRGDSITVHGGVLAALTIRRGMSGRELARRSGVPHSVIAAICRGDRDRMTYATARALSRALEVSMDTFADYDVSAVSRMRGPRQAFIRQRETRGTP